jgi:hypothetical protein
MLDDQALSLRHNEDRVLGCVKAARRYEYSDVRPNRLIRRLGYDRWLSVSYGLLKA